MRELGSYRRAGHPRVRRMESYHAAAAMSVICAHRTSAEMTSAILYATWALAAKPLPYSRKRRVARSYSLLGAAQRLDLRVTQPGAHLL
jgi:hypothetical protein